MLDRLDPLVVVFDPGHVPRPTHGVGIAQGRYSTADSDEHGEDINLQKKDQTGIAFQGGLGYEFHVTSTIATGMNVMANYAGYEDELFDHGWYVPVSFTLNWSFK